MRLAILQAPSPGGDVEAACQTVEAALTAAAAAGAEALVTPEVYLPGYNQPDIPARAMTADSPHLTRLAAACARTGCALVLGFAERDGDRVHNSALCIGQKGEHLLTYRKVQLYGPRERALYVPGDALPTFRLDGETIGILICYDVEFAPHVKALADKGATVILAPTANMQPFTHVVRYTVPAMAANHGVAIAYANFCGVEDDLTYVGGSLIAGPHGEVLVQAGEHPALLIADLPAPDPARISTQSVDLRTL